MNIRRILFPVDFSECSRMLNAEVEWAESHFGSDVTLMHVFEIPAAWYGTGEAPLMSDECLQQLATDAKKRLEDYSLRIPANRVNRVIAEGDAASNIKNWVEEHHPDLVMMGTHGYGSVRRALLGSVAMKLLHDIGCPIWTHSGAQPDPRTTKGVSKILCALELTEEAVPLLRFVSDLAQDCGASVQIIHTVPETESRPYRYFDMDLHNYLKECAAKDILRSQKDAGTDFPVTITDGFVATDTAALAAAQDADLVVIGRGKTQGLFGTFRTHTYDIIREAPCSVLSYCSAVTAPASSAAQTAADAVVA
jgi:nucleotide-binding universal stress UspA family protein